MFQPKRKVGVTRHRRAKLATRNQFTIMLYVDVLNEMGRNSLAAGFILSAPGFHRVADQNADQAAVFKAFCFYDYARHVTPLTANCKA